MTNQICFHAIATFSKHDLPIPGPGKGLEYYELGEERATVEEALRDIHLSRSRLESLHSWDHRLVGCMIAVGWHDGDELSVLPPPI